MSNRFFMPRASAFDINGDPISGGKLWFYEAGTSTPRATYSDAGLTIANANPVVANSAGRFGEIFLTPSVGYKVVLTDADDAVIWTADPYDSAGDELPTSLTTLRNRVINGGMQLSRENGENNVDVTTTEDDTLDNWLAVLSSTPGGTLRVRQLAQATPGGSNYRMRCSPQVSDASLAAGDYYTITQRIEGYEIADAEWGSAFCKQVLVRFGVQTTTPGTYGVSLCNDALNRSWVGTFAISASEVNQDVVRTFAIPGTNAGTWLQTTGIGMRLRVCLAAGSTFQGAAGWQTGDFYTTSAQTNFMNSAGVAWFDLFDVGLYVDTQGIGVLPSYEMPSRIEDLLKTQRYFWATADAGTQRDITVVGSSAAGVWTQRVPLTFPVRMRAAPTISVATTGLTNAASAATEEESATGVTLIVTSSGAGDFAATYTSVVADARL